MRNRSGNMIEKLILSAVLIFGLSACVYNESPVSHAGPDMTVIAGQQAQLNGSESFDPDGSIVEYKWTLTRMPQGSQAGLEHADDVFPVLNTDMVGTYIAELVVSDGESFSGRDHVIITAIDSVSNNDTHPDELMPGVSINAGPDQAAMVGTPVILEGELITSADMPLHVEWQMIAPVPVPPVILNPNELKTEVIFQMPGVFELTLNAIGENGMMLRDVVVVTVQMDEFSLGEDRQVKIGSEVPLTYSYLGEPESDEEPTVTWTVMEQPDDIAVTIFNELNAPPYFIPEVEGEYVIQAQMNVDDETYEDVVVLTAVSGGININFDHTGVTDSCVTCHDGAQASGKPANHIISSDSCESCHSITSWLPALVVDHSQVFGPCIMCHDGVVASGKPAFHIPTPDMCDGCHSTVLWSPVIVVDHNLVVGVCADCHNGTTAAGKNLNHPPTDDNCGECHNTLNWIGPAGSVPPGPAPVPPPAPFPDPNPSHQDLTGNCLDCHNGVVATGKTPTHIASTDMCNACHATVTWVPVIYVDHAQVIGRCFDCHNNVVASGKNATHPAASENCEECHNTVSWIGPNGNPLPIPFPEPIPAHPLVTGACMDCHNGIDATGKSINHILATAVCEACHTVVSWMPIFIDHNEVIGACDDCHNGIVATGKSTLHIETVESCDACHSTSSWRVGPDGVPTPIPEPVPMGVQMMITSNSPSYMPGETVIVDVELVNNSSHPFTYLKPSPNTSGIIVEVQTPFGGAIPLHAPDDPEFDTPVISEAILQPGDSLKRTVIWNQIMATGGLATPGIYRLRANVMFGDVDSNSISNLQTASSFTIEQPTNVLMAPAAVLVAMSEPDVGSWYVNNDLDLICRLNGVAYIHIVNFDVKSATADEYINRSADQASCEVSLVREGELSWQVSFMANMNGSTTSFDVLIDASAGVITTSSAP